MDIFNLIKEKIDANGDGKLDTGDLEGLQGMIPADMFEQLKGKIDASGDGKIGLEDIQSLDFGGMLGGLGDTLGGFFKK